MTDVFTALAHPVRRKVLRLLRDGPKTAGELAAAFPVSKPTMSRHFATLKAAGLLLDERSGTSVRYRLNASVLEEVTASMLDLFGPLSGERASRGPDQGE